MAACAVLALAPPPAQAAAVAAGVLLGLQAELGTLSAAAGHQLKSCERSSHIQPKWLDNCVCVVRLSQELL